MNELIIFNNPEFGTVRTLEESGNVLFCAKDVAAALAYKDTDDAIRRHCRYPVKRGVPHPQSPDKTIEMTFIQESDLYRLVFSSKLPTAEKFTDWVTEEVLPSIRKHGAYMTPDTIEKLISNPDTIIQLATALKEEQGKRKALEIANSALTVETQIMKPKADYFDDLVDRNLLTNFRDTAKQFHTKQNDFVSFLLTKKYIYRDKSGKLLPYQRYVDEGLFELKECINEKSGWKGTQTLITPKGRETFRLLFIGAA